MENTQKSFAIENIITKYRNYVMEHCPKVCEANEWQDGKGEWHFDQLKMPKSPEADADQQLLVALYKSVAGECVDIRIVDALSEYSQLFRAEALSDEEFSYLCDNFAEVVSYEFTHREEWFGEFGGYSSDKNISKERIRLVKKYVKPQKGTNIFIADAEFCDIATMFPDCTIFGFTGWKWREKKVWAFGQIRLFALGINSNIVSGVTRNDTYDYELPTKGSMDVVVVRVNGSKYYAQPIFGTECRDIEALYNLLKPGGKMLFFSEMMEEMAGNEAEDSILSFRNTIVRDKSISSIVEYEDKEIFGKGKDSYLLLVIEKKQNIETNFFNEQTNRSFAIKTELLSGDILWPSFYITKRPENGIPLSELVTVTRDYFKDHLLIKKDGEWVLPEEYKETPVVAPSKMAEEYMEANLLDKKLDLAGDVIFDTHMHFRMRFIKEPCVLLYGKNERFAVGYVNSLPATGVMQMTYIVNLIPKEGVDVRYIAALLFAPEVKDQIVSICQGRVNSLYISLVLDKIIVPKHTEKERISFLMEANYEALQSSRKEMKRAHENYTKAVRMRKHALTQSLSSIEAMFFSLNEYRKRQQGNLTDDSIISRVQGTTVKQAFEYLSSEIKDMMPVLEHIADVEYTFAKPESIDPEEFIEDYVFKESKGWLNFKPVLTWKKGQNKAKQNAEGIKMGEPLNTFVFPKDALEKIFNNILSNAKAHAFTDDLRKDYQIRFSWHMDGFSLVIEIENNGTPIPKDRDIASLLEYGVTTALHQDGHNGIGCNEISDIMSRYDGSVAIISTPTEVFTVKYVLTFNNSYSYIPN